MYVKTGTKTFDKRLDTNFDEIPTCRYVSFQMKSDDMKVFFI
jgi:hypothetical protein